MSHRDELTDLGLAVVHHVHRFWLTTADAAQRMVCPDSTPEAVRKALARLAESDWLVRHPFGDRQSYYVLGSKALQLFDLRRPTKPLGYQSLLERYAVLLACARHNRLVFTEDEFCGTFPDLAEPGRSVKNYFCDTSAGGARLGQFLVDHDKLSSRLVMKVRSRVGKIFAADRPAIRQLILDGQFAVHVITATEHKRQNLLAAFARRPPRHAVVVVDSYPELTDFFLLNRR